MIARMERDQRAVSNLCGNFGAELLTPLSVLGARVIAAGKANPCWPRLTARLATLRNEAESIGRS